MNRARHLFPIRHGWRLLLAAVVLTIGHSGFSAAQALRDPTQPPAAFLDPSQPEAQAATTDNGLRTIKRMGRRYTALLNGEWLRPGQAAGEAIVERISDRAVVLAYPDGRRETLGLYPDVELSAHKKIGKTAR